MLNRSPTGMPQVHPPCRNHEPVRFRYNVTRGGDGTGTLNFRGQDSPFRLITAAADPGGGPVEDHASGEVHKVANIDDSTGRYTHWQRWWLRRDEIFVRMNGQ